MVWGGGILDTDIIYQDELVCILKPEIKKGIIIWSKYKQPIKSESICESGLKSGQKLSEENPEYNGITHPYIFFRAPYEYNEVDYSNIKTEINSSYGYNFCETDDYKDRVYIRVDPYKTYVFSSGIREKQELLKNANIASDFYRKKDKANFELNYNHIMEELNKSKKTLSEYLEIIKENKNKNVDINNTRYNLYTSEKLNKSIGLYEEEDLYPETMYSINKESEILVKLPELSKDYFILCT